MRPGRFRHRFQIEAPPTGITDAGQPEDGDWTEVLDARGEVKERDGSERVLQDVPLGDISHVVTLWYQSGVAPEQRVNWGGRLLAIESVITDQRKRQLTLACKEQK